MERPIPCQSCKKQKSVRCKFCKKEMPPYVFSVSGIQTFFMGKKISLSFDDFLTCDDCADKLRAAIKKGGK